MFRSEELRKLSLEIDAMAEISRSTKGNREFALEIRTVCVGVHRAK